MAHQVIYLIYQIEKENLLNKCYTHKKINFRYIIKVL